MQITSANVKLKTLRAFLATGRNPGQFPDAVWMGGGAQQTNGVVRIGPYIIKRLMPPAFWGNMQPNAGTFGRDLSLTKFIMPVRGLRKGGMCRPRYWLMPHGWVVMPAYDTGDKRWRAASKTTKSTYVGEPEYQGHRLDLHAGNYGVNFAGYLTAFDW